MTICLVIICSRKMWELRWRNRKISWVLTLVFIYAPSNKKSTFKKSKINLNIFVVRMDFKMGFPTKLRIYLRYFFNIFKMIFNFWISSLLILDFFFLFFSSVKPFFSTLYVFHAYWTEHFFIFSLLLSLFFVSRFIFFFVFFFIFDILCSYS